MFQKRSGASVWGRWKWSRVAGGANEDDDTCADSDDVDELKRRLLPTLTASYEQVFTWRIR